MNIGDRFECVIEKLVFGGDGITRAPDGTVVFVPRTLAGEVVVAEITAVKRDFCRAEVKHLVSPSPERRENDCPLYGRCAGCDYRHLNYGEELRVKNAQLLEQLSALFPESSGVLAPAAGSPSPDGCRNKLVLHVRKVGKIFYLGYVADDNFSVVDVEKCLLARPEINAELAARRAAPGFVHTLHDDMRLTLRRESATGRVHLFRNNPDPKASWLKETLPFGAFSVPLGSFFQVNPGTAGLLAEEVAALIGERKPELFLDLYCGSGFFSCAAAAAGVREVRGVEIDAKAVECAKFNLKRFPGVKSSFVSGDAAKELKKVLKDLPSNTLALVDPPRGGLAAAASSALANSHLSRLCYVSCNASTLARDGAKLKKSGFTLKKLRLFDMFPRTRHFEVLALFER